ncbi:MAG: YicC family protein [Gammaproteobacteria bacterium]|nr:YicC family protein [Gammaproteobacteria bacterium]
MTSFARCQAETDGLLLTWELRSVNHRFLETHFRLPDTLRSMEHPLREVLRKQIKRGKVDCTLRLEQQSGHDDISLNRPFLLQILDLLEQIRTEAPDIGSPTSMELLKWPGVLDETPGIDDNKSAITAIHELFQETLIELISHRQREGAQLSATISRRLDEIDQIIEDVKLLISSLGERLLTRLKGKVADLASLLDETRPSLLDEGRLEQEVVLLAQRADVTEELDRLSIHVEEARNNLLSPGPQGRRLDFLAQELNREANTLGSKSAVAETSRKAVDLKVIIEQIREQVQNVE